MQRWIQRFLPVVALLLGWGPVHAEEVVRVGHFPNITHVQALVARNFERHGRNWFAEKLGPGVRIEWYAYNAGPSAMEAIFANAVDLTYVGPSPALNAYARSKGDEIRIIAGAVNGGAGLVVQPDSGLANPADFKGKRIATPQFGNTQDVSARAWLIAGGLRVTQTGGDAQVLPTANPDQLSLFQSKQLDAVWTVEPWLSRLEVEAGGRVVVDEKDAITTILVSSAKFLSTKRDLARRFLAAHRELTEWIRNNPAEAQRMVLDELKAGFRAELPAEVAQRAWNRVTITPDVALGPLQASVASAQKVGFMRGTPDLSRLIEIP